MKNVDYIIVGLGLAGIHFCDVLQKKNKSYVVIDDASQHSSIVAGGLYNPVILKRFTEAWKADEQLQLALPIYKRFEQMLNVKLDYKIPVRRLFNSIEEQNNWFIASDKPNLSKFLSESVITNTNKSVEASFGYGEVNQTGRIDTKILIETYKKHLVDQNVFINEPFDYDNLIEEQDHIRYKDIQTSHIVFAEGFGLKQNPFFNNLPLDGTKGELLIISAPELKIDFVLKSSVFLIPLEDDLYIVGATYEWNDKTNIVTQKAKDELLKKLDSFINCDYKVIDQVAGMRPTVVDRRPLVGRHEKHQNMYVLNGLGTRGVMIAPYVAQQLYNFIENKEPLDKEISIERFLKKE